MLSGGKNLLQFTYKRKCGKKKVRNNAFSCAGKLTLIRMFICIIKISINKNICAHLCKMHAQFCRALEEIINQLKK